MRTRSHFAAVLGALSTIAISGATLAAKPYALVTGRRDPGIYAVDLAAALQSQNNNTPNAIIARTLVNPVRYDGKLLGDPANIIVSEDQRTAYVMNHHGAVVNAEFLQHGGRGNISVMDVAKMLKRENDNSTQALLAVHDLGWFGGVGLALVPDAIIGSAGEGWLAEAGSNRISIHRPQDGWSAWTNPDALDGPWHPSTENGVPTVAGSFRQSDAPACRADPGAGPVVRLLSRPRGNCPGKGQRWESLFVLGEWRHG